MIVIIIRRITSSEVPGVARGIKKKLRISNFEFRKKNRALKNKFLAYVTIGAPMGFLKRIRLLLDIVCNINIA